MISTVFHRQKKRQYGNDARAARKNMKIYFVIPLDLLIFETNTSFHQNKSIQIQFPKILSYVVTLMREILFMVMH